MLGVVRGPVVLAPGKASSRNDLEAAGSVKPARLWPKSSKLTKVYEPEKLPGKKFRILSCW